MSLNGQLRRIEQSLQQNDRQGALRRLRKLLKQYPDEPELWWLMANANTDVSQVKEALDKTIELDPNHTLARQTRAALQREFPNETATTDDLERFNAMFDAHGIDMDSELANKRPPDTSRTSSAWDWLQSVTGGGSNGHSSNSPHGTAALNPNAVSPTPQAPEPVDDRPLPLTGLLLQNWTDDDDEDEDDTPGAVAHHAANGRETIELADDALPWENDDASDDDEINFSVDDFLEDLGLDTVTGELDVDADTWERNLMLEADTTDYSDTDFDARLTVETDTTDAEDNFADFGGLEGVPSTTDDDEFADIDVSTIDVSWLAEEDIDDISDFGDLDAGPVAATVDDTDFDAGLDVRDDTDDHALRIAPGPDDVHFTKQRSLPTDSAAPTPAHPPESQRLPETAAKLSTQERKIRQGTRKAVSREFRDKKRPVQPPPDTLPEHPDASAKPGPVIDEPPLQPQDSRGFSSRVATLNTQTLDTAHHQLVAMVRVLEETAELCRAGTQFWVPLLFESVLSSGDYVRMDDSGRATLHIPGSGAVLELHPRSAVQIAHLSHHNPGFDVELALVKGAILADFSDTNSQHARYAISTPFAEFLLEGATLALRSESDGRTLAINTAGQAMMQHAGVRYVLQAGQGVMLNADGSHSGILPASSFAQLSAAVDGVPFQLASQADVQLNVRRGPSLDTEHVGTIDIHDVQRVHAVSADKYWYRVRYGAHYRWISARDLSPITDAGILPVVTQAYVEHDQQIPDVADEKPDLPTPLHRLELALLAEISEWRVQEGLLPLSVRQPLQVVAERLMEASMLHGHDAPEWADNVTAYLGAASLRDDGFLDQIEGVRAVPGALVGKAASEIAILGHWKRLPVFKRLLGAHSDFYEVGLAATRLPDGGFTFVLVIGSVQAPTPVLLEPASGRILVGPLAALLPYDALDFDAPLKVQLVTRNQKPGKKRWLRLQTWLPAPTTEEVFGVIFTDGKRTHRQAVDPAKDIAWLPYNSAIFREVREG